MVATTLDGTIKSTFHGNRLLLTGTLGADGNFTDVNHHLGLVSVDAFENQAKADSSRKKLKNSRKLQKILLLCFFHPRLIHF